VHSLAGHSSEEKTPKGGGEDEARTSNTFLLYGNEINERTSRRRDEKSERLTTADTTSHG
jgi:hypothetical protein